jgi:hypothetical protein
MYGNVSWREYEKYSKNKERIYVGRVGNSNCDSGNIVCNIGTDI